MFPASSDIKRGFSEHDVVHYHKSYMKFDNRLCFPYSPRLGLNHRSWSRVMGVVSRMSFHVSPSRGSVCKPWHRLLRRFSTENCIQSNTNSSDMRVGREVSSAPPTTQRVAFGRYSRGRHTAAMLQRERVVFPINDLEIFRRSWRAHFPLSVN